MKHISLRVRKLLALAITCCLLITTVGTITTFAEDISGHWAIDDINFLREKGIVRGDDNGNINPDDNITRAELIALINRTFEYIEAGEPNFPDVEPGSWYYNDLAIAKNQGYIQGDDNGNANPGNPTTRAEVAVSLARVLDLEPQSGINTFADSASFPDWSVGSIVAMTERGLVRGYPDNTFRASNSITRAEVFTIIARILRENKSQREEVENEEIRDEEVPAAPLSGNNNTGGGGGSGGNPGGTVSKPVAFQDPNFKEAVVDHLKQLPGYSNYTKDSDLYAEDLAKIASLHVSNRGITSMRELPYFINLEVLDCSNNNLAALDINNNTQLLWLCCGKNNLSTIDLSNNTALTELFCIDDTTLATLDLRHNTSLQGLFYKGSQLESVYFTQGSNICSIEINGNGCLSELVIEFYNGQIHVKAIGETTPNWELSGTTTAVQNSINPCLTDNGIAHGDVIGTQLVANFPPLPPPVALAMVIGYNSNAEIEDGEAVTKYTATIIDIDGVVHDVPTTAAMYDNGNGTRIGVVSLFEIDDSGRYTFFAPEPSDPTYNVDDGITKIVKGGMPGMPPPSQSAYLQGGTSVYLVSNNTKFVLVNYIDDPNDDYNRIPDGTVTVYIGRNNVPAFGPLSKTTAVSHDADGTADSIANIVFIFDDVCPACEFSFVYIVGSWYLDAAGYNMDVILDGKRDVITVKDNADHNALQAMAGQLWDNIKVDSNRRLDLTSAKQLFYDASAAQPQHSASVSIKNNSGLLELDGVYSGYTAGDDVPVYIITRSGAFEADVVEVTAANLDEDGFVFAYLNADSDQIVSAIYIIRDYAERTITSFATVNVYTNIGIAPIMPTPITAYYSDGSRSSVFVTWDSIDSSQYASVGTFTLHGTVSGISIQPVATVTVLPSTPPVTLAMVISYDSYSETEGDALVTIYTATIIDIDGVVHNVPTTQGMYNSNARIGVVSLFAIDNSGRYLFTAPIADSAYNIDNGITRVETGETTLQGGASVNLANNSTKFVLVNYMDAPDNDNNRIPDGTVTIYIGRNNVPSFESLSKTTAVSHDVGGTADSIANIVFIFDDVYADHEFSFVYIVGSWYLDASGYNMDVILKGKWDVITVKDNADRNALQAMAGQLWGNIIVTSDGVLDLTSARQLFHDSSAAQPRPSASVSIKSNSGLLELDGFYSGYTAGDDVPVYIITRVNAYEADVVEVTAANLDEDGFDFAYLNADSDQIVSAIYIIK